MFAQIPDEPEPPASPEPEEMSCHPRAPEIESEADFPVLMYLSPDLLEPSPDDPRQRVRDGTHETLVESLRAHGQDHSISAYPLEGGRYQIRTGVRVWYAALNAYLSELRVEVHPPTTRLEALRVTAREDETERPRGPYERALLTGRMRAALTEALGRVPTIREIAPELGLQTGATCERLMVYDWITAEVIQLSGITREELCAIAHSGLHRAARKETTAERAAWLHYAARRVFPAGWEEEERPRAVILRQRDDGSVHVESPAPSELSRADAERALKILGRFVDELERRVEEDEEPARAEAA